MRGAVESLLVTDIVGSTRLWSEHESAMAVDLVAHDAVVNDAIAAAGGRVFKHTGDGVMATFESAADSAIAAAEVQRAISSHAWQVPDGIRVRIALHSGRVHERDGDLFGPPVNRLARLLTRCSPGAVIVSEATKSLLADGMPDALDVYEIGRVELRDVGRSEAVYCLVGDRLESIELQASVGAAGRQVGSLPPIDDDLVGRSTEIAAVLDAIALHPVVSIVGVGGMGKTRLALEAAAASGLPDGAWWCDLTAATSPDAVPATVLAAVGGRQSAGRSAVECLVDHLATRHMLVVFDNCEHVVDAARALVTAIRVGCDMVRVLATSREALGLRGEHVVPLSSLPAADAIGLFCTRAVEARADLVLDDTALAAIDDICTRVDGIPLAIELAAARCRSMAPSEIATRLDDRFRLLRGGRGGVERHRTLLAAVEWSYSLLEDDERDLFDRMAVFAGGALIDAVASVGAIDEYDALDILDRLIARSMVVATGTELGTRYRQLETLRQFADDRLAERDASDETRARHLGWAHDLAARLAAAECTAGEVDALHRYIVEIDNFRAAVNYALNASRYQDACELIDRIAIWSIMRPTYEVLDWLDPTSTPAGEWTRAAAQTAGAFAASALFAGDPQRTAYLLAQIPGEFERCRWVLSASTFASLWVTGDMDLADRCVGAVPPAGTVDAMAWMCSKGQVFQIRIHEDRSVGAEYEAAALAHGEHYVAEARRLGGDITLSIALSIYGYTLEGSGDLTRAVETQSEAVALAESSGAWFMVDAARAGLVEAITKLASTDPLRLRQSAAMLRSTIAAALERRNRFFVASYLSSAVERLLWVTGDHRTAALLGTYGRHQFAAFDRDPTFDADVLGAQTMAEIEIEAAGLDIDSAGQIALAALDKILLAD